MSEFTPILAGMLKAPVPAAEPVADPERKCPNCGVAESRWKENGRDCVNLDPFTGNCVDCLREYAREMRPRPKPALPFDARAAQARNDA